MRSLLLFMGLFVFSCSSGIERGKAPDDLLSKDKMVEIITDLSKHEAYIQYRYQRVDRYTKVMSNTGDSILKVYGVDRNRFESSLDYYATHQTEMKAIYDEALNNLNKELGAIESK